MFASSKTKNIQSLSSGIVADNNTIDGCSCDVEKVSYRPAMPLTEINTQFFV